MLRPNYGVVTAGHRPRHLAAGLEFCAETDHRLHARLGGEADDVVQFGKLLDDKDDFFAEFAAEEHEADVIVILVAVADDQALVALVHGEGDHQLGLGAGLEAVVEILARGDDLIDNLAELVDLDREHAAVFTPVAFLLDGLAEHFVELHDAMAQQVLEPDDHRRLQAHAEGLVDDIEHADAAAVGARLHADAALGIHGVVAGTPAL